MKKKNYALQIAQGGIIAGLYVALTLIFAPISFGEIQLRVAEMLTILPMFTPAAIPGLFVGCLVGNILGGAVLPDIIFGSLATLIGAVFSWMLRKHRWLVPIPAVMSNTLIIPFILKYAYGIELPIILLMVYIFVGEVLGCYVLGELLAFPLMKMKKIFNSGGKSGGT